MAVLARLTRAFSTRATRQAQHLKREWELAERAARTARAEAHSRRLAIGRARAEAIAQLADLDSYIFFVLEYGREDLARDAGLRQAELELELLRLAAEQIIAEAEAREADAALAALKAGNHLSQAA